MCVCHRQKNTGVLGFVSEHGTNKSKMFDYDKIHPRELFYIPFNSHNLDFCIIYNLQFQLN